MEQARSFIINGKFMEDKMQGIVRYARELVGALDTITDGKVGIAIALPHSAKNVPEYKNIRKIFVGNNSGIKWEQNDLKKFLKTSENYCCINLCNVMPLGVKGGITTIHDIMYRVNSKDYTGFRNILSRLWHEYQYKYVCKNADIILTVSEYSKGEIEKYYPSSKGKLLVIPNAWQHILRYKENPEWNIKYPFLKSGEYFFSMATLAKNKNGKWIIDAAEHNPDKTFAIAGGAYNDAFENIPSNVHLLGFAEDSMACSLIKHCRAFIYPSLYEGFGLPPLEALALGAEVISSDATSLPEVLGSSVHYIDPSDSNVDLNNILKENVKPAESALNRFSWRMSAEMLLHVIKEYDNIANRKYNE